MASDGIALSESSGPLLRNQYVEWIVRRSSATVKGLSAFVNRGNGDTGETDFIGGNGADNESARSDFESDGGKRDVVGKLPGRYRLDGPCEDGGNSIERRAMTAYMITANGSRAGNGFPWNLSRR